MSNGYPTATAAIPTIKSTSLRALDLVWNNIILTSHGAREEVERRADCYTESGQCVQLLNVTKVHPPFKLFSGVSGMFSAVVCEAFDGVVDGE